MFELVKVIEKDGMQFISSLKEIYLGAGMSKAHWSKWCGNNIEENKFFSENQDYQTFTQEVNGNYTKDYACTLEMAKHLIMQMQTDKAHEYRDYLMIIEKAWNTPEQIMARALEIAKTQLENYKKQIEVQKPKVEFYDEIVESKDACDMKALAGLLAIKGLGRNNLFQLLREKGILSDDNLPYRLYIDRGYFKIIESKYLVKEEVRISFKTVVFQKGVAYVRKIAKEHMEKQLSKK